MPRLRFLVTLTLLSACAPEPGNTRNTAQAATDPLTLLEAPPYPPIERLSPKPVVETPERRRWLLEERTEARELPLLRRIKREEMGNFGGVEWRWRDGAQNEGSGELTGIAYFLREPAKTLARYTRNPLFRAARGDFARSDQDRIVRQWAERIGRDVAFEGFGNMQAPWLDIAAPRAEFERRARTEEWRIPANLRLRFDPRAEPDLPSVTSDLQPLIRAFPQALRVGGAVPDIATFDAVVLRNGCFFIDEPGEDDPLIEFPLEIGVYRDGEGHLAFRTRYAADKRRLGRVGTRLQLGFRAGSRPAPPALARPCGATKIVAITSVDQAAGYGSGWFAVKQYRDRERLSTAEAIRRANACLLAQERTMADNRLRAGRKEPARCEEVERINPIPPSPPPPNRAPTAQAISVTENRPRPPKLLEPKRNGVCRFDERAPAERPKGLNQTSFGSNMVLWADRGAALWDHPNGFTDEGMVIPGKRIVAARKGMKDLWISPALDGDITLYSGPDRFECVAHGGLGNDR